MQKCMRRRPPAFQERFGANGEGVMEKNRKSKKTLAISLSLAFLVANVAMSAATISPKAASSGTVCGGSAGLGSVLAFFPGGTSPCATNPDGSGAREGNHCNNNGTAGRCTTVTTFTGLRRDCIPHTTARRNGSERILGSKLLFWRKSQ